MLAGFNSTILAYGQTQAGKTYTILGDDESPGLLPTAINYIFDQLYETRFKAWCCCYEVYNDRVYDLFDLKYQKEVHIREDGDG